MQFEWDENKNRSNFRKHGIDFADAAMVFFDTDRIEALDERNYCEDRIQTIGVVNDFVLFVVYTIREFNYRMISARRATKYERETYLFHKKFA